MTKKRLPSWEQFRILKVRSSAACSHIGLKIFSKTLTESITLTQKWGKTHEKSGDWKRNRKWQMRGYTIYPKWLKRLFRYYRTVPNRIANCTEQYRDFLQFLKKILQDEKKIRVGTKIVGRVGLPEPHNFFVLALYIIPALNHIKNQYQAPTRFSEDRVNVWGINSGWTWTKRNNEFF